MKLHSRTGVAPACLAFIAGSFLVTAHDEDWRKLADRQPAVIGPIVHGPIPASALGTGDNPNFEAKDMTLQSWIPLNNFQGNNDSGNDCWGYVSPSGREYALMGLECGTGIVEITSPANATIIGFVPGPCSLWHDIKVIGHYAYVVSEHGAGIQVIDLSQVDAGIVTHVGNVMKSGHSTTHNIAANPESGYLYLCGANVGNGGLVAVSTSNPEDPTIVGMWTSHYVHDATVVSYASGPYAGKEIAFAATPSNGLNIIDVTNKSNMHTIGQTNWTKSGYPHQCWLSEDRQHLFIGDEFDEQNYSLSTRTIVIDVSDLNNPKVVGEFTNGLPAIDHNQYVKGNLVFQSNYRSGLRVWDITNPLNPDEIAWFDTYPGSNAPSYSGTWSNYPYFPSGTIIISDMQSGLFVVTLDCYADCDGNKTLDLFDFLCFVNDFNAQSASADCDESGALDLFDFLCFTNKFNDGCPGQ